MADTLPTRVPLYTTEPNVHGKQFAVLLVRQGDGYGVGRCLVHDKADPLVEFYDTTYAGRPGFDRFGQFVSRYSLSVLIFPSSWMRDSDGAPNLRGNSGGLLLHGGEPKWTVSGPELQRAIYSIVLNIGTRGPLFRAGGEGCLCGKDHDCRSTGCDTDCPECSGGGGSA